MVDALDARVPLSLRQLVTQFGALELGLGSLALYHRSPNFEAARRAVESSTQLSFRLAQLQQVLALLPEAFALEWKRRVKGVNGDEDDESSNSSSSKDTPFVLTIRKLPIEDPNATGETATITTRIAMFRARVNEFVVEKTRELQEKDGNLTEGELVEVLGKLELPLASLPPLPSVEKKPTESSKEKNNDEEIKAQKEAQKKDEALQSKLTAPVPQELQTLPAWLVEKVRRREAKSRETSDRNARALERRVVSTLPQLSDQLELLALASRKSVFALDALEKQLGARAPVPKRIEEQIYLLESMVPFWLSVRLSDGKQFVQLARREKFHKVKAALRKAVAEALDQL